MRKSVVPEQIPAASSCYAANVCCSMPSSQPAALNRSQDAAGS
jgi:hypothetical protein